MKLLKISIAGVRGIVEQGMSADTAIAFAQACLVALRGSIRSPSTPIIVTNLSTSSMIDVLAERAQVTVRRTPIGQAYVSELAQQVRALLAGEGSGQVILPQLHPGSESVATIVLILQYLAKSGRKISQLVEELPRFHIRSWAR